MERHFLVRRTVGRLALRAARWKVVGRVPRRAVMVGAPHTSNWDWLATVLMCWSGGVQPLILVKKELFTGPLSVLLKAAGSVPLDRANPGETVRAVLERATGEGDFVLAIAAEGTRGKTDYWKSGFYRISQQTGLPIALGFIDGPTRTVGVGPVLTPTGDVAADMDVVRAFYADKHGINPGLAGVPRLREEGA